jgi:hypothetical protein
MTRLDAVASQQIGALMFFDQLSDHPLGHFRQLEIGQTAIRHHLVQQIAHRSGMVIPDRGLARGDDQL